ncbi:hypothetical protein ACH4FX_12085 [Streptomyces sp. NPDC018019]|uniref:hypothetical protein n=1 Tax=Streptomyces sp. NPDC018019 TaxID=3365030 RepID=UPI0037B6604A
MTIVITDGRMRDAEWYPRVGAWLRANGIDAENVSCRHPITIEGDTLAYTRWLTDDQGQPYFLPGQSDAAHAPATATITVPWNEA